MLSFFFLLSFFLLLLLLLPPQNLPDIVIVRKTYPKSVKRSARRKFRLKRLDMEAMADDAAAQSGGKQSKKAVAFAETAEMQFEEFVHDVEEDPDLRAGVNVYRRNDMPDLPTDQGDGDDDEDQGEIPEVPLEEMLEDLDIGGGGD